MVGEIGFVDRDIGVATADIPDAMRSHAFGRHESDLARRRGTRDVEDADAGGVLLALQEIGRRSREIGLGIDLHRPRVRSIDGEQQVVMGLEMNCAGVGWTGEKGDMRRMLWVAHVDDADAVRKAVADIGIAAVHHDLDAVAAPALVGASDELDVARCYSSHASPSRCGAGSRSYRVGGAIASRARPLVSLLI